MVHPPNDGPEFERARRNRHLVERFFLALEGQNFEVLLAIFAPAAKKLMPYAPPGFPETVEGAAAIYKQFSELPELFTRVSFPRQVYLTDDPDFIFAKFTGKLDQKGGGTYENDYVATFKLENEQIMEYCEYFNPFIMATAFGITL
jgi:ketosteroid isomerase-like protein